MTVFLIALAAPGLAHAEWREAETPHFRIYSGGGEQQLIRFAERLEMMDALLRKAVGAPTDLAPSRVRIILLDNVDQVKRAYRGSVRDIAGFYTVNLQGPLAVSPRRTGSDEAIFGPELILFHEYAHHFLLQYSPASYPAWYVEGFAEIAATAATVQGGKMAWGKAASSRDYSLSTSRWVPVEQLMGHNYTTFPKDADFYGQSWLLAHYLTFSGPRAGQLGRYLALLGGGRPQPDAAREAFGDLEALNREVRRYLDGRSFPYRAVPVDKPARESIRLRPLTPGEAALMEETASFRDNVSKEDRAAWLASFRAKAERFPTDTYALRLLADAEYLAEDYAASRATADRLLAIAPNDVGALTRKATILLREAENLSGSALKDKVIEARKLIAAANRIDPDDPGALVAFYESYRVNGERPPPIAVDALRQAVGTIPQDYRPRMLLASQLADEGKLREAIFYLGPIAYDPHPSEGQQAALNMINRLRQAIARPGK